MHLMRLFQKAVIVASSLLLISQFFRGSPRYSSHDIIHENDIWNAASGRRLEHQGGIYRNLAEGDAATEMLMVAGADQDDDEEGGRKTLMARINSLLLTSASPPPVAEASEEISRADESSSEDEEVGALEMLENMEMILMGGIEGPPSMASSIIMNRKSVPPEGELILTPWKDTKQQTMRTLGAVTREFLRALPEDDVLRGMHYNTCAIVGNAGILLEDEFGPSIDAHDLVMRFNIGPTKGYEKHVGHKTTIRLVNRKHFGFRETDTEMVLQHLTLAELIPEFVKLRRANPDAPTYALDMSFYEQVLMAEHQFPTNGFFGIHLALMLCRNIDIYGFLRNWKGWVPYHYFNAEEPNDRQTPRDNREQSMIELLVNMHPDRLRIMHPCIFDDKCDGCSRGALCNGNQPFPVPRLGHCRLANTSCFFMCKPGIYLCGRGDKGECVDQLHQSRCVPPHGPETLVLG